MPHPCDTQVCTTDVEVTVTPRGAWMEDGFLDDVDEIATFDVHVVVTFSDASACVQENDLLFQMFTTEFARTNITPSRHSFAIPANGGIVELDSRLEMFFVRGTPPLSEEGLILRTIMQECAGGPQAGQRVDVVVSAVSEIRPGIDVEFNQPDLLEGAFRFRVLNTGNANLFVAPEVEPVDGSPFQEVIASEPVSIGVGDLADVSVDMPRSLPGNYTIRLVGRWTGDPDNASVPHVEYAQPVQILAPPPPPAPEGNTPTPAWLALAAVAAAVLARPRRPED